MVNHLRTLVLNAAAASPLDWPAEEVVSEDFTPISSSVGLQAIRSLMFGTSPDRAMLNLRTRQLFTILHASRFAGLAISLDPRLTYLEHLRAPQDPGWFQPKLVRTSGAGPDPELQRVSVDPDASGQLLRMADLRLTEDELEATVLRPQLRGYSLPWSPAVPVVVPGLGWALRFQEASVGSSWTLESILRPERDLGALLDASVGLGVEPLTDLFSPGGSIRTPFRDLYTAWAEGRDTPLRLAALVAAWGYRAELRRISLI